MEEEFDSETLHHLLGQFSKNVTADCLKVIEKLLISESESIQQTDSQEPVILQRPKTFANIKKLLNLYEKLHMSNNKLLTELPVDVIVRSLNYVLHCNSENCNIPDNDIQCNILLIVSSIFRNCSAKNQRELAEFYVSTLTSIKKIQGCKSDCLIFKLKVLNSIYNAFKHITFVPGDELLEMIKTINNVDECRLLGNLVLHDDDAVAIQALMHLIPEYINYCKSERVVEIAWEQISNNMIHPDKNHCRALIVLCNFFDLCLSKSKVENKTDMCKLLLEDKNFWNLVQFALVEVDPLKRKQGLFLLKKSIDLIKTANTDVICDEPSMFFWSLQWKDDLEKIYDEIIICLEFLEEQQVHIIKPVLSMIETLGKKIIECDKVSCSWVLVLYKKALIHESTQIVKWGLSNFLKLPKIFFSYEYIIKDIVSLLINTLSDMGLYYNNALNISTELTHFFNKVAGLNTAKFFFSLLIQQICSQVCSAEALFFIMHSLSHTHQFSCWAEREISEIGLFVSKAFKTHNKIIRTGVQCELLKAVTLLADTEQVTLDSLVLLISKFCLEELIQCQALYDFSNWLRNSYSKKEADKTVEKYKKKDLEMKNGDGKFISTMLILFYFAFYSEVENSPVVNYICDMALAFREIHKRPYCDKLLYDQFLSVLSCTFKYVNYPESQSLFPLVKLIAPFIKDIIFYIKTQLQQISNLQDFNICESYLNSFQVIHNIFIMSTLETERIVFPKRICCSPFSTFTSLKQRFIPKESPAPSGDFQISFPDLDDLCKDAFKDIQANLSSSSSISPVGIYWRIRLSSVLLEKYCSESPEVDSSFLYSYLCAHVNEPLSKDGADSQKTRDLQTLWGRMNSKFIGGKWIIFTYLNMKRKFKKERTFERERETSLKLCLDALNSGGYGILRPVMFFLKIFLSEFEVDLEFRKVIASIWRLMMERRKTEEFKALIADFVELLYSDDLIKKGESAQEILLDYADLLFSDSSQAVTHLFMKGIQMTSDIACKSVPVFVHILGKGLIFGPITRKDEKLTNQVCSYIEFSNICPAKKIGDYDLGSQIRAVAVQIILNLRPTVSEHRIIAKSLLETLLKMESEINKNRVRYFGNSHVHRVKHRLMQSLLLLEPMLDSNEDSVAELSSWVYNCLMTESSQPSVRFQQEWLLIRMLLRHPDLYSRYCISNCKSDFNKRSLCSAIAVSYHLCKLSPSDLLEERITMTMNEIVSFCFHQHFEVRLYAQVVFQKLYIFAEERELGKVKEKFQFISISLANISKSHSAGNYGKILDKIVGDFYFNKFNPLEHYSLESIYKDLPGLMSVDSDEWISIKTFESCGVTQENIRIPLKNSDPFTEYFSIEKENRGSVEIFSQTADTGENPEVTLENYQKKIIPQKPLIPGWDENCTRKDDNIKKDGLIVVASLIDRIPNLGGLARTCEIFGVSQYVVGSFKCIEDKQFTSLSVTAEKWINIKEVKPQNLKDYIFEMKLKGYTVIGAEQMLYSLPLSSAKFPRKSLLLLGNEKEGIPPNLLPLLDVCIEIPQLGIIRSLNVHVTGALFIWEYAKQNHFS